MLLKNVTLLIKTILYEVYSVLLLIILFQFDSPVSLVCFYSVSYLDQLFSILTCPLENVLRNGTKVYLDCLLPDDPHCMHHMENCTKTYVLTTLKSKKKRMRGYTRLHITLHRTYSNSLQLPTFLCSSIPVMSSYSICWNLAIYSFKQL